VWLSRRGAARVQFPPRTAYVKRKIEEMLTANPAGSAWLRAPNHDRSKARRTRRHPSVKITSLKLLSFFVRMFRQHVPTKQFSQATKPFSVFEQTSGNSRWLSVTNETAHSASA
jgi:hypothetical protein